MYDQGAPGPFNSNSIICSLSISPNYYFFKSILSRKNWRGGGGLLLKNGILMLTSTNQVIDRAGITSLGALGTLRFSQHLVAKYRYRPKKSYNLSAGPQALCHIMVNPALQLLHKVHKRLDEGLR